MREVPLNPIQLHTAGATVQHVGAFSNIEVPVVAGNLPADVREKWVRPLYFGLRKPHVKEFLESHLPEVDDELIYQLLGNFDWRPRVTAAYLVALSGRSNFTDLIGRLLVRSDVCFAGAVYCLALAKFNNAEGISYLKQYLAYYLKQTELWFDQGDAMAALIFLDETNGTDIASEFMDDWIKFIANKSNWNLDRSIAHFNENMILIQKLRIL
jgi:hypothetical protein